ncbi:hypothetical protein [Streptomyces sp. NPDC002057]|uniref:hypothetical protein n=1 Tax=Streptomyces sp. NPDC002057 TaxID=3154664 RepID=UPI003328A1FB
MESYRLTWTQAGREERQVSAVSYSAAAAETFKERKKRTAAETGVSDIEIVAVKPGVSCVGGPCEFRVKAARDVA